MTVTVHGRVCLTPSEFARLVEVAKKKIAPSWLDIGEPRDSGSGRRHTVTQAWGLLGELCICEDEVRDLTVVGPLKLRMVNLDYIDDAEPRVFDSDLIAFLEEHGEALFRAKIRALVATLKRDAEAAETPVEEAA